MSYLQTVNNWEVGMNGSKNPNLREFQHNDKRMLYFTNSFVFITHKTAIFFLSPL